MAKKKSNKLNAVALAAAAIALVGLVLTIVGLCTDWVTVSVDTFLGGGSTSFTLGDLGGDYAADGYDAMNSLAIITVVVSALAFVLAAATMIAKKGALKLLTVILSAAAIVCAVVAVICTYTYCGDGLDLGDLVSGGAAPAAGAWLLTVGGVICGLGGAYAALKS